MRTIIGCVFALLIVVSCNAFEKNEDTGSSDSPKLADVQIRSTKYVELLGDPYQHVSRCDSLTFVGHYNASAKVVDIYRHEYDGWIHRSTTPCNTNSGADGPKMDSRSEVSKENILAWFHNLLTLKDYDGILRTIRHARDNNWCFARGGDDTYNCAPEFAPLLNDWEKKIAGASLVGASLVGEEDAIAIPQLEGFRGNVMHSYVLLKGRAFGYLRGAEVEVVKTLIATVPTSPLYRATLHRFTDGDHGQVLKEMTSDEWPLDRLPAGQHGDPNVFQWEGSHPAMLYVWTVAVLEGR